MSDLATILDLQGRHDDALVLIQQAVDLSRAARHPDQHVLLGNMAGILLHKGEGRSKVTESRVCFPSGLRVLLIFHQVSWRTRCGSIKRL